MKPLYMQFPEKSISDKFSTNLKKSLSKAYSSAWSHGHQQINTEHLLWGLASQKGCIASEILNKVSITPEMIEKKLISKNKTLLKNPKSSSFIAIPVPSKQTKKILKKTVLTAKEFNHQYIGTEHLLAAILESEKELLQKLLKHSVSNYKALFQQTSIVLKSTSKFPDITETFNLMDDEYIEGDEHAVIGEKTGNLENFAIHLTCPQTQENIDPVISRDEEINRLTEILLRRTKNNPLLVGDPGVGKTAIVEGLAKKIQQQQVPPVLLNKKIYSLNLGAVISGTIYRGEFEERVNQIIEDLKKDKEIILFIDEIHMLIGTGATAGSMDAANILKPALARGDIRCIGATTYAEYKKHIENDSALERRFQLVRVNEPSLDNVKKILHGVKPSYESFHKVHITDEAIDAAVNFSKKYLPQRFFPDKAIDLIDEASSKKQIKRKISKLDKLIQKNQEYLNHIKHKKDLTVSEEQYDQALQLHSEQINAQKSLESLQKKASKQNNKIKDKVTKKEIASIVSSLSGIPESKILENESKNILDLERKMNQLVIGQKNAIQKIAKTMKRNAVGLKPHNKPMGSFIFAGPSGVGKTLSAKILAETFFGNENHLVRLDMSEYSEKFNMSKLLGAPAGYVGYQESGILSNKILQNPYSVILFDEVEKAHPDVFNILLQILDEGRLMDGQGKKIDFTNNIIILTTNIGSEFVKNNPFIGFNDDENQTPYKALEQNILEELKKHFRPELLNRIEQKIVFTPLDPQDLNKIIHKKIDEINDRLKPKSVKLKPSKTSIEYISQHKCNKEEGARDIDRILQEIIEDQLAEELLRKNIEKDATIQIDLKDNKIQLQKV